MWSWLWACSAEEVVGDEPEDVPPAPEEQACSGADEDEDGLPGLDDPCIGGRADVVLHVPPTEGGCCTLWSVVPDADGDGRADVLLQLEHDAGQRADGPTAWLVSATVSGRADELAFASFDLAPSEPWDAVAGSYDEVPGTDYWVQGQLFTAPSGALDANDATADLLGAPPIAGSGDFDGDGIDDLLFVAAFRTGTYHSGGYTDWSEAWLALGPFSGPLQDWDVIDPQVGAAVAPFDVDGDGIPEIQLDHGSELAARVIRADGEEVAQLDAAVLPTLDVDGDGFDDAFYHPNPETDRTVLLAGPFAGAVDLATHPTVASWTERVFGVPDLDGDGRAEVARAELTEGLQILRPASGAQGAFDADAHARFHTDANLNSVPSGGPFVADLGGGPEADLALGVHVVGEGWNDEFRVFFQPLY